uniref:Uncharacterized protein n=1 Tax=Cacopsylla melanoneura TaxID=428564 RepID=A0A8D8UD45_9HEMI
MPEFSSDKDTSEFASKLSTSPVSLFVWTHRNTLTSPSSHRLAVVALAVSRGRTCASSLRLLLLLLRKMKSKQCVVMFMRKLCFLSASRVVVEAMCIALYQLNANKILSYFVFTYVYNIKKKKKYP